MIVITPELVHRLNSFNKGMIQLKTLAVRIFTVLPEPKFHGLFIFKNNTTIPAINNN